jgi:hypothetical protein
MKRVCIRYAVIYSLIVWAAMRKEAARRSNNTPVIGVPIKLAW